MPSSSSQLKAFLETVKQETVALEAFAALLKDEQKLLISGSADDIVPLLDQKSALTAQLSEFGQQREKALVDLDVGLNPETVIGFVEKQSDEFRQAWQTLLNTARAANQINTTNGKLINTRLQYNQQALNVLMTAAGGGVDTHTYGPDGQQHHTSGPRKLGSA